MSEVKPVYTLEDLRNWESVSAGLEVKPRLAVIGDPVQHSASPQMHNPALKAAGIDAQYVRVHVKPEELSDALDLFRTWGFIGVNVTIPHKQDVAKLMSYVDPLAKRIGAVNTVLIEDGEFVGFNSDAPGFRQAIRAEFSVDLRDLRVMILGAGGGAGRGATIQCAADQCERLVLVNRTQEKADAVLEEIREDFAGSRVAGPVARLKTIPWETDAMIAELDHIDLIVNGTNLGMKRSDPEILPARALQPHHMIYDMVYSPPNTQLMSTARAEGARAANGLSMLLWQGVVSFEHWFNRQPDVSAMRAGLSEAVGNQV